MKDMTNFTAFDAPVTKQQILDAQNAKRKIISKNGWLSIIFVIALCFGVLRTWALNATTDLWFIAFFVNFSAAAVIGAVIWWICVVVSEKTMERRIRFEHFARDNNLTYLPDHAEPTYQGIIFSSGSQRQLYDRFRGDGFEAGNYQYTVQHGKSSSTYKYGYIRIDLERHVAHMLLDAKHNNMKIFGLNISNLPVTLNKDQTLSLEGDFNEHFTLYAPKEYERDALYIFTPDLMALLIDHVAQFDVEVIDDQLFVYGKEFRFVDRQAWQRISEIISKVGQKTITRTDYYADEKIGDRNQDIIANPGKRLRRGVPWYVIVFAVLWILGYVLEIVFVALGR
jgi:hypothetical protein